MAGVKEKSSDLRWFTYYLYFPDGDVWHQSMPFIHDIQFEISNMRNLKKHPDRVRDLMQKGDASWKDQNGVKHRIVIEDQERPRVWGTPKKDMLKYVRKH